MNKIKNLAAILFACLALGACKSEMQDLNTNPELLPTTDPRYVFTGATENWNNCSRGHLMSKYSGVMQLMQYIVFYNGAQEGIYAKSSKTQNPGIFTPYYGDYFGSSNKIGLRLRYLVQNVIPSQPDPERYKDLAAVANILEVYQAWLLFDVEGAAPYHEAFKSDAGIMTPKYEFYQDLYKEFDQIVKDNVAVLHNSNDTQWNIGNNDYFYRGDVSKWIKFANTLRIKMAQRLEKADASFYSSTIADALADKGGIISSNDESCIYYHPNEYNNNTDDTHILTYQYCASRAFVNFLANHDDPRLPLLVRRNGFGDGNLNTTNDEAFVTLKTVYPDYLTKYPQWVDRYVGMSANPDSVSSTWSSSAYFTIKYKGTDDNGKEIDKTMSVRHNSQIESRYYIKNGGKVGTQITARDKEDSQYDADQNTITLFDPQITYSEVCFMMAEIALKANASMGGKSAATWFTDGIRASMEQYQTWAAKMAVPAAMDKNSPNYEPILAEDIDAYLAKPEFKSVTLEKIVSQQWVNLFMHPEEMWATWKRTGYPSFMNDPMPKDGVAYLEAVTSGNSPVLIPRRCILPEPNSKNIENYNAAITALTSDANYGTTVQATQGRIWWDKQ